MTPGPLDVAQDRSEGGDSRDRTLNAVFALHGLAMNGGLFHALEVLSADQVDTAISGFRHVGAVAVADHLTAARSVAQSASDLEAEDLERRYQDLVPTDSALEDMFENLPRSRRDQAAQFSPERLVPSRRRPITALSVAEALEDYEATAVAWAPAALSAGIANKLDRRLRQLHARLSESEEGRTGLSRLMDHAAPGVRLRAAIVCLAWDEPGATRALEALIHHPKAGLHSVTAKYILLERRKRDPQRPAS